MNQINEYINQLVETNKGNINSIDIERFFQEFYPESILSDGNGTRNICYDSFKTLDHFDFKMKFSHVFQRRNFLKKIRKAIISHNNKTAIKSLEKIKELQKTIEEKNLKILNSKEDLLFNIILNKNPEKLFCQLVSDYNRDKEYGKKIELLEYMIEHDINKEYGLIEICEHYLKIERDYEKCKNYALKDDTNLKFLVLLIFNEHFEKNYCEMIKYFNTYSDKIEKTIENVDWNFAYVIIDYISFSLSEIEEFTSITSLNYVKKILTMIEKKYRQNILLELCRILNVKKSFVEMYQILKEIVTDMNDIPKKISNEHNVIKYINKCNLMSKNGECCICLNNDVKCIPLECCHYFCFDCYPKILQTGSCPSCRCKI